jgi:cell division protein FtsN
MKRLLIWSGLIIVIAVISAAGWLAYVALSQPATETRPPIVRGKIPQMPQSTSAKTTHRASVPPVPEQQKAAMAVVAKETPADSAQMLPDAQHQNGNPVSADQPDAPAPTASQEQRTPEPAGQAPVETAAEQSEDPATPDTAAVQAVTSAQGETSSVPAAEPTPAQQAAPLEQASAASAVIPEPAAKPAPKQPPKQQMDAQFTIQAGAYRNKEYAENTMALLSGKGYEAYIDMNTDAKSRAWYLVRFGYFPTRQAARWALNAYQDKEQKRALIVRTGER